MKSKPQVKNAKSRGRCAPAFPRKEVAMSIRIRHWKRLLALMLALTLLSACGGSNEYHKEAVEAYRAKAELLKAQVLSEEIAWELGDAPAGDVGHVVFISVCDTMQRADVYSGTAPTLEEAWTAANAKAEEAIGRSGINSVWVKADAIYASNTLPIDQVQTAVFEERSEFFRYGLAFDSGYETALLEAELNGNRAYDYDAETLDLEHINAYLEGAGRKTIKSLPQSLTVFQCVGWLCDENDEVYLLDSSGLDYGRRTVNAIDDEYAAGLIYNASEFLLHQMQEDGSFVYGYYPRVDRPVQGYNIIRHTCTIWALLYRYRIAPSEEVAEQIDLAIQYMISQIHYNGSNTAYLYDANADEYKLGANGVAIVALSEYMDAFQTVRYKGLCEDLGNGILTMLDQQSGEYYHVLDGDFNRKEAFRIVYYDGEATFALCRLYALTGEEQWLDAAKSAVDHFIEADYIRYADHWVAYSMNELLKYVTGNEAYYTFALQNIHANLDMIYERDTTYHTYLEMLMAGFETYDLMLRRGVNVEGFDQEAFLRTIYARVDRMLNGYFYPEYAMYMQNPQRILQTFMVRHQDYRVRIDDVQHNIGGYYLYCKNYNKLVEYGLLECIG